MIAARIHEKLNKNLADLGNNVYFPIRIGVLLCDSGYENIDEILRDANTAQSLANAQGEVIYKFFDRASIRTNSE
jgi:hypothetical protein